MHRMLKILLSAEAFFILAMGMLGPIYAIFVTEIGGDIIDASGAWAVFMLTSGATIYLLGKVEDHSKHQGKYIVIGYLLRSLGFLGYMFVATPLQLFMVQVMLGAGIAVYTPAYDSLYSRFLSKGKFASEWALWEGMYYVITAIAAILGGIVATYYGFNTLFIIMFLMTTVGFGISFYLIRK